MFHRKRQTDTSTTPTGSRRPVTPPSRNTTVFSYHAYRSAREEASGRSTSHYLEDERPRRSSKFRGSLTVSIVIALIIIAAVGANLRLSSIPNVVILGDSSNRIFLQNTDIYKQAAQKDLQSSVLNGNKATIDATKVTEMLHGQFPELAAVSVTLPIFGSHPTVYVVPVMPQLILQDISGQRYILDDSGRVLASDKAEVTHGVSFNVPIVTDQSGLPIRLGQLALPDSTVSFITEVAGQLHTAGVTVSGYTLPGGGASEIDAQLTGESYIVRFNLHGNARVEAGDYLATAQYLSQNQKKPSQYIDVQVDGRAYYK